MNVRVTGTTTGYPSGITGSCGGTGPEVILRLTLTTPTAFEMRTDNPGTNFDTVLYVRQAPCDSAAAEIGCNDDLDLLIPQSGLVATTPLPAGVYYIFVDGYNGASGNFELTILQI
jgi:hypothetical protein